MGCYLTASGCSPPRSPPFASRAAPFVSVADDVVFEAAENDDHDDSVCPPRYASTRTTAWRRRRTTITKTATTLPLTVARRAALTNVNKRIRVRWLSAFHYCLYIQKSKNKDRARSTGSSVDTTRRLAARIHARGHARETPTITTTIISVHRFVGFLRHRGRLTRRVRDTRHKSAQRGRHWLDRLGTTR